MLAVVLQNPVVWIAQSLLKAHSSSRNVSDLLDERPLPLCVFQPISPDVRRSLVNNRWLHRIGARELKAVPNVQDSEVRDRKPILLSRLLDEIEPIGEILVRHVITSGPNQALM